MSYTYSINLLLDKKAISTIDSLALSYSSNSIATSTLRELRESTLNSYIREEYISKYNSITYLPSSF